MRRELFVIIDLDKASFTTVARLTVGLADEKAGKAIIYSHYGDNDMVNRDERSAEVRESHYITQAMVVGMKKLLRRNEIITSLPLSIDNNKKMS